jgi:chaperonin cofactor prefoldin
MISHAGACIVSTFSLVLRPPSLFTTIFTKTASKMKFYLLGRHSKYTFVFIVTGKFLNSNQKNCQNFFVFFSTVPKNKQSLERLDDASTELMMSEAEDDKVMLLIGESFFYSSEEKATEYCEQEVDRLTEQLNKLEQEEASIVEQQAQLKKVLYGRFGKSIQLEA